MYFLASLFATDFGYSGAFISHRYVNLIVSDQRIKVIEQFCIYFCIQFPPLLLNTHLNFISDFHQVLHSDFS